MGELRLETRTVSGRRRRASPKRAWRAPPRGKLLDRALFEGYVTWEGIDREEFVPTALIVGASIPSFLPNWSLKPNATNWDREKVDHFMKDGESGGLTQSSALSERGFHGLYLLCVGGLYFVGSGGNHRVAAAHQKEIPCLRATVSRGHWKRGTPKELKVWFERTRISLLENVAFRRAKLPRHRLGSSSLYAIEWLHFRKAAARRR